MAHESPCCIDRQEKNSSNGSAAAVNPLIRAGTGISPFTRNWESSESGVLVVEGFMSWLLL
jgi:hypothetical protein